ncbi:MAG: WYL domain-containing protein, partial [Chloroflexota bacterium]|nr:WYL domain-containing protein [Chloroflexota bacterium]
ELRDLLCEEPHTWERIRARARNRYTDDENGKRKLRRDLQYLARWGYRKVYDPTTRTYALVVPQIEHDWTESELSALAALRESFTSGTPYAETIQALLKKIEKGLSEARRKQYARKPALTIKFAAAGTQSPAAATRQKLEDAIREHRRVSFRYQPSDRPQIISHPDDEPLELEFRDGHYYLWAYCYKMNKVYPFRVDMIVADSAQMLPKRAEGRWQRQAIHFQYWLSPKIAARGPSPRFPEMDWEPQADGSMIVTAQAYSDFQAIQEILRYGEQAEIISPDALRAKMRRVVEQMAVLYGRVVE